MSLRQSGAVAVPVLVWAFCAAVVVLSLVEDGSAGGTARTTISMASIAFLAWMFLFSPCLVLERDGLRVVNPLRAHRVPFAALEEVQVRGLTSLVVRIPGGGLTRITSWNAPGIPRAYTVATPPVAQAIEQRRASWEQTHRSVAPAALVTTWRGRPLLGLLLVVLVQITIWWR